MPKKAAKSKEAKLEARVKELEAKIVADEKRHKRELALREILDEFDFERVEKVCNFLEWEVYDSEKHDTVPVTIDGLIKDAKKFAEECWEAFDSGEATEEWSIQCGPLRLWWCECEEGIFAELDFVCESWRVEPVND